MMFLLVFVFSPCMSAKNNQFVIEHVQAAPTDVEVRLETQASSKMTCSALCASKDYVSFTFTVQAHTCHCFF